MDNTHRLSKTISTPLGKFRYYSLKELNGNGRDVEEFPFSIRILIENIIRNFNFLAPGLGICHQVNLEYLAKVAIIRDGIIFPDTLVGTDSHTPMINGIGVLGWGVGGIEAEAVMLGQPLYMLIPEAVGFRLEGQLPP